MTIKTRNGLTYSLYIFSFILLIINLVYFIFFRNDSLAKLQFDSRPALISLLFGYQPMAVFISLFFMNLYVVFTSRCMTIAFSKTQCTEICFFYCFLVACLFESTRFYIPVLQVANTYSELLILLGDLSLFARILAPLSLLSAVIMSEPDQRQNLERNMLMIIVLSMFIAMVLPLNTGVLEKDFRVHVGFDKIVVSIEILVDSLAIISLFFVNYKEKFSQWSTVGLAMIIAGFVLSINSINFFILILSIIFFSVGTTLYMKQLHDRNLYS